MTRTKSSITNLITALIGQFLGLIISFVARIIFVKYLTSEYLGVNGLFTNFLTILSLVELGVGPAMTFSLYKPLAEKDTEKVKSLMRLYKRAYICIGISVLILGISFTPIYPFFIDEVPNIDNLDLIYILFVVNTAISYFYSYKRSLIICDQKRYIATIYRYAFYFLLNVAQIICLVITQNYILYLVLQIIFTWLENFCVSRTAMKIYPYLKEKNIKPLDKSETDAIKKNIYAMIFHKIGGMIVNSTDNLLISKLIGLVYVGIYSNYYMIIQALETIIVQVFNSIVASIGNLSVNTDVKKIKNIFDKTFFMNFWIFGFCSTCLIVLFNNFIYLWLGEEYLFEIFVVLTIVISFYLKGMRKTVLTFRDATGNYYYDRYKPVIESIINLGASLIFSKYFGIAGIFLGTIFSTITTSLWIEPYMLYKYVFKDNVLDYFKKFIMYTIIAIIGAMISYKLSSIFIGYTIINLILKLIICIVVVNGMYILLFRKTEEFKYYCDLLKKMINKTVLKEHRER